MSLSIVHLLNAAIYIFTFLRVQHLQFFFKWKENESTLKSVLNPEELEHFEANVSSTQVSRCRGISKEFLSKLYLVTETLIAKEMGINN